MHETHRYDLSYVIPERTHTAPEIVFTIKLQHLAEAKERLAVLAERFSTHFTEYFDRFDTSFVQFTDDLFSTPFGYGGCGYLTTEPGLAHLHIRLAANAGTLYASATIFLVVTALGFPFAKTALSNRQQDAELSTWAEHRFEGWGHAMHGHLSCSVMKWLRTYAIAHTKAPTSDKHLDIATNLPTDVLLAMRTACRAITAERDAELKTSYLRAWVRRSGAFSLECWGDACDVSVYPDQVEDTLTEITLFGCHNLDTSEQQLTLLAGLAKLCELART